MIGVASGRCVQASASLTKQGGVVGVGPSKTISKMTRRPHGADDRGQDHQKRAPKATDSPRRRESQDAYVMRTSVGGRGLRASTSQCIARPVGSKPLQVYLLLLDTILYTVTLG
jgi:hypothetical protein